MCSLSVHIYEPCDKGNTEHFLLLPNPQPRNPRLSHSLWRYLLPSHLSHVAQINLPGPPLFAYSVETKCHSHHSLPPPSSLSFLILIFILNIPILIIIIIIIINSSSRSGLLHISLTKPPSSTIIKSHPTLPSCTISIPLHSIPSRSFPLGPPPKHHAFVSPPAMELPELWYHHSAWWVPHSDDEAPRAHSFGCNLRNTRNTNRKEAAKPRKTRRVFVSTRRFTGQFSSKSSLNELLRRWALEVGRF